MIAVHVVYVRTACVYTYEGTRIDRSFAPICYPVARHSSHLFSSFETSVSYLVCTARALQTEGTRDSLPFHPDHRSREAISRFRFDRTRSSARAVWGA
ncbi:uncharacterized protein MICPUCDRAFT_65060 [Micromonas pusilla CCMP1545]|uniref:Predicted protein n=1 Tax=Micromonas pusilla (strain CCMP1545) TaxID=564608 RepID=C1MLI4_MICPC|nr:uncharacterized protein MICPUCDRAFT_65060 [Micromonas pusilla CCMP1545]EEH59548.1 predicted protein [Micromonas pusilla CCMP1545]|eukprot:XP_003056172.1 predicted protein [Micromonas pusilla CCMP1545]